MNSSLLINVSYFLYSLFFLLIQIFFCLNFITVLSHVNMLFTVPIILVLIGLCSTHQTILLSSKWDILNSPINSSLALPFFSTLNCTLTIYSAQLSIKSEETLAEIQKSSSLIICNITLTGDLSGFPLITSHSSSVLLSSLTLSYHENLNHIVDADILSLTLISACTISPHQNRKRVLFVEY